MNNNKAILVSIAVFLCIISIAGLINFSKLSEVENTSYTAEETLEKLNNAKEIEIIKNYFTIANDYNIIVDGEIVGIVQGEVLKLFGDVFTMRSSNGELISYEIEEILHLNNQASIKTPEGEEKGRIESELLTLLYKCSYYDSENNLIATSEQNLDILRDDDILDVNGNVCYHVQETNMIASNLVLTVHDNSSISPEIAIYIACINEAIDSSK